MAAQVNTRISPLSPPGIHGVDAKDIFVAKWETFNDQLRLDFVVQANAMADEMNIVSNEISIKSAQVSSDTIEVATNTAEVATNTAKALTYAERAESAVPVGDGYNMDTVDLKDSNVLNASLPNNGYTKVSKKLDNFVFKEEVGFEYKVVDKNKYIKFGNTVVDTHIHSSYDPLEGGVIADFTSTAPNVTVVANNDGVAGSKGDYFIDDYTVPKPDRTLKQATRDTADMFDYDDTLTSEVSGIGLVIKCTGNNPEGAAGHYYKRLTIGNFRPASTNLEFTTNFKDLGTASAMSLDNPYFRDREDYGVTHQVIATQKNLTKDDDGITPLQNGYTGVNTEILLTPFDKDSTIEDAMLGNDFTKIKPFLYSKDGFLHTPVERRQMNQNQYMYHPFLNPFGTKKASDGNFWHNTSVSFLTVADCFNTNKLLSNSGDIASGVTGSPRNRYYDTMYKEDGTDSRQYAKLANKIDIDLLKKDKLDNAIDEYFSSVLSGSFFDVELLGDSTYYPQILKDRITSGIVTQVLLNTADDNGNSNVPDGIKTSFKMNKKMIQNYEVLKSTDSGVTWSKLTSGFTVDLIANNINFAVAPLATDIILISNEASNNPMYLADIADFEIIEEDSFVYASNNNDITNNIVKLINNVTGKISVGTDSVEQLAITKIMNDLVYQTPKTATVDSTIRFFTAEKDGILYAGVRFDNGDTASIDLTDTDVYVVPLNIGRN